VLFSTRRFKQCGARYFDDAAARRGSSPRLVEAAAAPDETDRRIINALQGDFPLVPEPYREVAEGLGLDEAELLRRLDACSSTAC
jgi:CMP-2-keto-3-deoxyoctulosonic acid synthetase